MAMYCSQYAMSPPHLVSRYGPCIDFGPGGSCLAHAESLPMSFAGIRKISRSTSHDSGKACCHDVQVSHVTTSLAVFVAAPRQVNTEVPMRQIAIVHYQYVLASVSAVCLVLACMLPARACCCGHRPDLIRYGPRLLCGGQP